MLFDFSVGAYYSHEGLGDSSLVLRLPLKKKSSSSSSSSSESASDEAMVLDVPRPAPQPAAPQPRPVTAATTAPTSDAPSATSIPRAQEPKTTLTTQTIKSTAQYPTHDGYWASQDIDKAVPFLSLAFLGAILQQESHQLKTRAQDTEKHKLHAGTLNRLQSLHGSATGEPLDRLLTGLQTRSKAFAKLLLTKGKDWLLSEQDWSAKKHQNGLNSSMSKQDLGDPTNNATSQRFAQSQISQFVVSHHGHPNKKPVLKGTAVTWKLPQSGLPHAVYAMVGHVKAHESTTKAAYMQGSHTLQDILRQIKERRKYFTAVV